MNPEYNDACNVEAYDFGGAFLMGDFTILSGVPGPDGSVNASIMPRC